MPAAVVSRERKLPVQQLVILAICRFAEPIATTSLFPYLPEMVRSFGVPEDDVGTWSGVCSGIFSVFQAIMGIPWGRFSDRYGRKMAILLGLTTTMLTALMWGFSTNLYMAVVARAIAGFGNGNVGIIRTTVAEMVPFKELQPRAFSLMPLVWNIGSIFGPMIGGALANPYNVQPREQLDSPNLLQRFPYALPNLVAAALFLIGIVTGYLFLEETLELKRHHPDSGLILGKKLTAAVKGVISRLRDAFGVKGKSVSQYDGERQPLLVASPDEEALLGEPKAAPPPPSYREVLNSQATLNLIVYTFMAGHTMAYDQLLPVFMHYPTLASREPPGNVHNGLRFAGGLGLEHFRIGAISTAYGICGMVVQFLFFPPVARRFGVLNCLKACAIAFPIAYFITPFAALLPSTNTRIAGIFAIMLIKCFGSIFAFPASTILLTNSASSLRTLGTLNGFATSFSAIGRAIGPAIGGSMFTLGVKRGYVIAPWWLFSAIGIVAAVPVWFLVEMEGFGGDDEGHVSDEEEVEEFIEEAALEGAAEAAGKPGPALFPTEEQTVEDEAPVDRRTSTLSRTPTVSTQISLGSALSPYDEEEGVEVSGSVTPTTRGIQVPSRRQSVIRIKRKMSMPVGMGEGISRRYSSNLGQSLGSAGSYHGHG